MKSIYTLQADIEELLKTKGWFKDTLAESFNQAVLGSLQQQFNVTREPSLRLSQMGPKCPKALWYSINRPDLAEPVQPWAQAKFSFGHFWEAYAIMLTKAAGHEVTHEQHECELLGVKGHLDGIVDGAVVDYKSCSHLQFQKYKNSLVEGNDSFGYLDQLDGYASACLQEDFLSVKDKAYIIAVHRDMGHIHVYEHTIRTDSIINRISNYKELVSRASPPNCTCETTSFGSSGNIILSSTASYSPQKWTCFPELRCFIYGKGPLYFVKGRPRDVLREIDKWGNEINS